jgi:hypothetical protein
MRQSISAIVAVVGFAIAGAAPAMACGYTPCGAPAYGYQSHAYPPAPVYPYQAPYACGAGCGYGYGYGAAYERLAEPTAQYYYVNQGPTYTGPGRFAPYPAYQESAVTGYAYPRHRYYHGAGVAGPAVYGYHREHGYRWGHTTYYHGKRVLRRYY